MGWKLSAEPRRRLLHGAEWTPEIVPASAAPVAPKPLPERAHVCVDANAVLRSKTFARLSALDVAKFMIKQAASSDPQLIEVFFDSDDTTLYPPQRAVVHAARYPAGQQLPPAAVDALARRFGATNIANLASSAATNLPLRAARNIEWQKCFACPPIKAFLWRILVEATRHAALELAANGELEHCTVKVHAPDGTIVTIGTPTPEPAAPPGPRKGEADLQTMEAARNHACAGKSVIIYTIDTDFLLMTVGMDVVPTAPFIVHLKCGVYDGAKLIARFGGTSHLDRLNSLFWLMAFGCDYADPLTKQGYYTKELTAIVGDTGQPCTPVFAQAGKTITLDVGRVEGILAPFPRRAQTTKSREHAAKRHRARPPIVDAFADLLFCVRYYSFLFPASGPPFPPASSEYFNRPRRSWSFELP